MVRLTVLLLLFAVSAHAWSAPVRDQVPDQLLPWIPWVLEGKDQRDCPYVTGAGTRRCAWPGRLYLELDEAGGLFAQRWTLHARGWLPLPGDADHWPQDVRADGSAVAVVEREGRPSVHLEPGEYAVDGRFLWRRVPQGLTIPREVGLLDLRLDGEPVLSPRVEPNGRLWLKGDAGPRDASERDSISLSVLRRVEDDNPLRVVTRLEMDVAGVAREITLGPVTLPDSIPLRLDSPLPARLEPDGRLRVQLRPGKWALQVTTHRPGPVDALLLAAQPAPWPGEEVWVFAAHPELRQVEVSGAPPVDPRQARLPAEWAQLPAYLMRPGATLRLQQLSRGDENPAPDRLFLEREVWLDFDGQGYTLVDRIRGDLTRSWRLEAERPLRLGRVEVDGSARFITRVGESGREGVEVRQGALNLTAVSRIDDGPKSLPAVGWALDFRSVQGDLHLPPGWRLLAMTGVDNLPETWLNRWTLLDLFLVLLIAIAAWRLWGLRWGALALAAMVLIWQEPGAPRFLWLNLLLVIALLRLVPSQPEGTGLARLRWLLGIYYRASLLTLAVFALPFLVDQARIAIFPQLERQGPAILGTGAGALPAPVPTGPQAPVDLASREQALDEAVASTARKRAGAKTPAEPLERIDPRTKVQTGPGVPRWTWTQVRFGWSGPVPEDHQFRLWLVPPAGNLALSVVRIALTLLFGLQVAGLLKGMLGRGPISGALVLAAGLLVLPGPSEAQEFPSSQMLAELRERLLKPPDCLPACADIAHMAMRSEGDNLYLVLTVDVNEPVAVPLPGGPSSWNPTSLRVDGRPFDLLYRSVEGHGLIALPEGRWLVELSGVLPPRAQVQMPLPLRPRMLVADTPGFQVQGVDEAGRPGPQIQLLREEEDPDSGFGLEPLEVPPLARVIRTLRLGLDWRLESNVVRLSSNQFPLTVRVPLIEGEQVLDETARIAQRRLLVSLPAGQRETRWSSSLEPVDRIELRAADDPTLSEEWRVDLGHQWHLEVEGIPVVHHQGRLERWLPTWRPWPGERVTLHLSHPAGVPGPTLTLTGSSYRIAPGRRSADVSLALTLLSSQGDRHRLRLPEGAELIAVRIDGQERPLRLEGLDLTLPLVPASQRVEIDWRQPAPIRPHFSPEPPDLKIPGVNARLQVELARDRWVLLAGGPALGPAVLFWGLALVLLLVSWGLGRSRLTPLRSWDWLLLGLGLSQAGIWTGLLVAGWLFALGLRRRVDEGLAPWRFNLLQIALALFSLAALAALVAAVEQGLLGLPEMQIAGNGSTSERLIWFQDRSDALLPQVWVVSVPILVYRVLMLAWALWLALRLIDWLRWGWQSLSAPVIWRETGLRLPGRRRPSGEQPSR